VVVFAVPDLNEIWQIFCFFWPLLGSERCCANHPAIIYSHRLSSACFIGIGVGYQSFTPMCGKISKDIGADMVCGRPRSLYGLRNAWKSQATPTMQ